MADEIPAAPAPAPPATTRVVVAKKDVFLGHARGELKKGEMAEVPLDVAQILLDLGDVE